MDFYDLPAQPSAASIAALYPNYTILKRRYRELALEFHPDKKNIHGAESFQKIDGVFRELKTLYSTEDGSFKYLNEHANFYLATNGKKVPLFRCLAISVEQIRRLKHAGLHQVEFAIAGRKQKSNWVNVKSGQAALLDFECLFFEWNQDDYLQVVIHFQRGLRYNKRDCETHILINMHTNFRGWIQLEHKDRKAGEMLLHVKVLQENDLASVKTQPKSTTTKVPILISPEPATRLCRSTSCNDVNLGKRLSPTWASLEPSSSVSTDATNLFQGLADWSAVSADYFSPSGPSERGRDDHFDSDACTPVAQDPCPNYAAESPCPPLNDQGEAVDHEPKHWNMLRMRCGRVAQVCDKEGAGSTASTAAYTPGSTPKPKSMTATPQPQHLMAMSLDALHKPLIDLRSTEDLLMDKQPMGGGEPWEG